MLKTRVIPCLLLKGQGLVKTVRFKSPAYIGDPINAVKIFNDKEVDELVFLDIEASYKGLAPNISLLKGITNECFMPLAYGGGIKTLEQISQLLNIGIEKVIINTAAHTNPTLIKEAVRIHGSSTIVISVDVKTDFFGRQRVFVNGGRKNIKIAPVEY
ncbi:MAG: HisA/HisF-related TIM barrel protein, partial [Fulvivirga sp.]